MTVGELKNLLKNSPDKAEVLILVDNKAYQLRQRGLKEGTILFAIDAEKRLDGQFIKLCQGYLE
ncbi:hypothetical protein MTBPR1_140012 [Candidatus Terasakiella magnetica]|uniref:Uncharacterized protein n=1 Tax=Candidatus Terasakiella magnetica TaxID=1867952 RepID=A0A1C3RFA6_9PROT|nr:hypothetical protein [Candidatus Terasakiella magnetica]SCA55894.1 hypothetical protein MTBPR1_140012 [Candidatus Terasakiella magnetica]